MKYAKLMFALVVTMLPMFATAQLGSNDRIVTKVPFEFVVGNKVVPAGECVVKAATADIKMVIISNGEAKVGLFSTILPIEAGKPAGNYALVFHQYGDRYFLSGMKIEGTRVMYELPESKGEAELRAQNVPATDKILLAYLQ